MGHSREESNRQHEKKGPEGKTVTEEGRHDEGSNEPQCSEKVSQSGKSHLGWGESRCPLLSYSDT